MLTPLKYSLGVLLVILCAALSACNDTEWNDPYPSEKDRQDTLFLSFSQHPKHLDPAKSYSENDWQIIAQIYEPPLEYKFQNFPYELQPLTAAAMPNYSYDPATDITTYTITIKPGIYYHRTAALGDTDKRELLAKDYVYQLKRLADPKINSPIFGFLVNYIVGLSELRDELELAYRSDSEAVELDLASYNLAGAKVVDDYSYQIMLRGRYPQFKYWLATPFFAPMPREAALYYADRKKIKNDISINLNPVGTGPFYLAENSAERRMVLERNSNYWASTRQEVLPRLQRVIFSLERESIPYWDKFNQGYYDASGLSSDNFSNVIDIKDGEVVLAQSFAEKGIKLKLKPQPVFWYWGFNMLDPVVGGNSERARYLRKAIDQAFDVAEYIAIFNNNRASLAVGPIPPGILGHDLQQSEPRSLAKAREYLKLAGYDGGIDSKTGKPLQLFFEISGGGSPDLQSQYNWMKKQLAKLDIDLIIRDTDHIRFLTKLKSGTAQMFIFGWHADYPDPENFFLLLHGPQSIVDHGGMNAQNYNNPEYDSLYEELRASNDEQHRRMLISKLLAIIETDRPWVQGFYPNAFALYHSWYDMPVSNSMANNFLKYVKISQDARAVYQHRWNQPKLLPMVYALALFVLISLAFYKLYIFLMRRTQRRY